MGATNAMNAYRLYAGRVPPLSMQLLAYMALVSKDSDAKPWFGQGHEALAVFAMGRTAPIGDADVRAVRRAITPLLAAGAIVADRRASVRRDGPRTVRYRLQLVPADVSDIDEPLVDNSDGSGSRRTESDPDVGRFVDARRTESVPGQDGNRPTEEPRGTKRSEKEENHLDQEGYSPPPTDTPAANPIDAPRRDPPDECVSCGAWLDPDGVCRNRQCDESVAIVIPIRRTA